MKSIEVWTLRIVTMPLRILVALLLAVMALGIALPLFVIFTVGMPEETLTDTINFFHDLEYKEIAKFILLGIRP